MITGDNPLTAVHVAKDVEIVDREALILDLKENAVHDAGEFETWSAFIGLCQFSVISFSQTSCGEM
jgi:magnesium-transporting ATPase (P-type)